MASSGRPLGSMIIELDMQSTKFESSLKSIQNQFRLAKSEMKANLSVLDTTGTSYEKASSKVEELSKLMGVNERQIQALKDRYDTAVRTNGEYSDSAMKIANQLNKAESQQSQYQRQLENAKVSMKDAARNTDSYRDALNRVQRETKSEIDVLNVQGRQTESNLVKYKYLGKEVNTYGEIITREKAKLNDLISTKGKDASETQNQKTKVVELSNAQEKAKFQYDELNKKVGNLSTSNARSIDTTSRLSTKIGESGSKIKSAGQAMTGFSFATGAALTLGVTKLTAFDSKMTVIKSNLEATGTKASTAIKETTAMTKDAENYSSKYGVSVQKISNGYLDLVKRGYEGNQALGSMNSLLQGSIASGDDFNDVVKVSTSTLESFNMKSNTTKGMMQNTAEVTNKLGFVADKTSTSFSQIGVGMSYVGSSAHTAGISLSETVAAMGLLSNNGVEADKAGTGVRKMLNSLASPTKTAKEAFDKYGISIKDNKGNMNTLSDIMQQMKDKLGGLSNVEKVDLLKKIFGTTGQQAASILMENGNKIGDLAKQTDNAAKSNYNATLSAKNMQSAQNQINKFKESTNLLAMSFARSLLPSLTKLANSFSNLFKKIASMPAPLRNIVSVSILVAAAMAPILMLIGQIMLGIGGLVKGISMIKIAMADMKIADFITGPWGIAIGVVIALGAAFILAYTKIKPFRDAVNKLAAVLKQAFENVMKWLAQLPAKVKTAFNGMKKWFNQIPADFKKIWNTIATATSKWVTEFAKVGKKMLNALVNVLKGFGKLAIYALALPIGIVAIITKPLVAPMKKVITALINWIKQVWTGLSNWLKTIWNGVSAVWHAVWTTLSNWFRSMLNGISNIWKATWNGISNFFTNIWNGMMNFLTPIMNAISNIISSVLSAIRSIWNSIWQAISSFFSSIWNGIVSFVSPAINAVSNIISSAVSGISNTWHSMWSGISDFFKSIWSGIKNAAQDGINGVIGVINSGVDAINSVWKFFTGKKTDVPHLGKVHFEQGGVVEQHLSVINDGKGKNWKELVEMPTGELMMSQNRNWTGLLPAGTRVYSGDETQQIMSAVGVEKYAKGGIVGDISSGVSNLINWGKGSLENVGSWVGDKLETMVNFLEHPLENTKNLMETAAAKVMPKVAAYADFAKGAMDNTVGKAGNWVKDHLQEAFDKLIDSMGGGGAMSAKAYGPMIRAAAAYMHQNVTDFNIDMIERIIGNESGGNPKAINLTDSNAKKGTPSKGILQYIDPTFRHYAMPGHTNIWNPMDQLIALFNDATWRTDMGMGYNGKYGEWRGAASGPSGPRLMADGGLVTIPTPAIVGEAGPEMVLPLNNQTRAMQIIAQAQSVYGKGNGGQSVSTVDTSGLESNQRQQMLLMEVQNKILSKILELLSADDSSSNSNMLGELSKLLDSLGLKKRNINRFQKIGG